MHEVYLQTLAVLNNKQKIDAVFCMSDEILCGVMKALLQLNLTAGKDLSVIAISDGFFLNCIRPKLPMWKQAAINWVKLLSLE